MALVRPNIPQIRELTGSVPEEWTRAQAALALDAANLIAQLSPWWALQCGYAWKTHELTRPAPGAGTACPALSNNARLLCHDVTVEQEGTDWSFLHFNRSLEYQLHRAPIPASLWAALAVVRSGGDLHYVRTRPVPVGGLFAIPLDTARSIGLNPWAVYDALRYVRVVVEGTIAAWHAAELPAPATRTLDDLLAAALFQYLAGGLAATEVFGALAAEGVNATSIRNYVFSDRINWSSRSFGVGRSWVEAAARQVYDVLEATKLVEGYWWAWQVGWSVAKPTGPFDAVPRPPSDAYGWAYPAAADSDPAAAARSSVVLYPTTAGLHPAGLAATLDRVQLLYPVEYGTEADLVARGFDAYQAKQVTIAGHYLTRQAVLAATVPAYLASGADPRPRTPQGPPEPPAKASVPLWAKLTLALAATAAAAGGLLLWMRRSGGRGRRR